MHSASGLKVAISGASSLLGKELKEVLETRSFPASDTVLLDETLIAGTLTEATGEPAFIHAMQEESFEGARFAFFAGSIADAERNWQKAARAGSTVIDLTGPGSALPGAMAWIPSLAKILPPVAAGDGITAVNLFRAPPSAVIISCSLAAALRAFSPLRLAIIFFPPVSERDQAGVEELESQTTRLLSFQPIASAVFDAQVAFNLLAAYGEKSRPSLAQTRAAIARDVAAYLAGRAALPAIQLVQAPVFYGYTFAAYADFPGLPPPPAALHAALAQSGIQATPAASQPPDNVSIAGESEIQIGRTEPDLSVPAGLWFWGAADNLRLAATNAVRIAEELLAS